MGSREQCVQILTEYMFDQQTKFNIMSEPGEPHNANYAKSAAINRFKDDLESQNKIIQIRFEELAEPLLEVNQTI